MNKIKFSVFWKSDELNLPDEHMEEFDDLRDAKAYAEKEADSICGGQFYVMKQQMVYETKREARK